MKKLFLVDVSSLFFRAFYALPPLTNAQGLPTNALYGFLSMTIKLLRESKPDFLAYCFDRPEASFRAKLYPEYKAQRTEMPEDLVPQLPYVRLLTKILGISIVEKPGFEADDMIGTLTQLGRQQNLEVIIVSGDKDFAQLISSSVSMYDTMKEVTYSPEKVKQKWGVAPDQMRDYLALVGDSSDNIPGVRGIGPKGAIKLLSTYGTLDGIYENLAQIHPPSVKAKLMEHKEMAYLSQKLVTLVPDVPLGIEVNDLRLKPVDPEALRTVLGELGFKKFEKSLLTSEEVQPEVITQVPSKKEGLEVNWNDAELKTYVEPYSEVWAFPSSRGVVLGCKGRVGYVSEITQETGRLLADKWLRWKGFDLKTVFRELFLCQQVVLVWDSMIAAYVIHPGRVEDFNEVYQYYVGGSLAELASPVQLLKCHQQLEKVLQMKMEEVGAVPIMNQFEGPLVSVLNEMEQVGIKLDVSLLEKQGQQLAQEIKVLDKDIQSMAGESFNVASPKQLAEILFNKMGVPQGKKTKAGFSTASDVLEKLAPEHPICGLVLKYRELSKLNSTYVEALPQLVNAATGRIHTSFRQTSTTTGRLSSVNPNLQNIPIRTDRGRQIRRAFVARDNWVFISADYSQIELRILAHVTQDPGLMCAFAEDRDVHSATAAEIFSLPLSEVTPEHRRKAKAVNFGIAYGQGAYGLSETLGISRTESTAIIKRYFERFPRVRDYMDSAIQQAKQKGYVETIFGRRRYIEEMKSSRPAIRSFGERMAINSPIQGTASDLVKLAMIEVYQNVEIPLLLQVHDELLFECPLSWVEDHSLQIKKIMEGVGHPHLSVPLRVNVATGVNWEDAHA